LLSQSCYSPKIRTPIFAKQKPMQVECLSHRDSSSNRKEETVMKTDVVLTMDEYLNACCVAPGVKPPAKDARHVPITTEDDADRPREHGCRCDRWGHPCPGCVDKRNLQASPPRHDFSAADKGGKQKWST
jgi:hypothetical protein